MLITIRDRFFGTNYLCQAQSGTQELCVQKAKRAFLIDVPSDLSNSKVEINIINELFSNKKQAAIFVFFYWLISLLSGAGEGNVFGKPYNAKLVLALRGEDVTMDSNRFTSQVPFSAVSESADVLENSYWTAKGNRTLWFWGLVIPVAFLMVFVEAVLFTSVFIKGSLVIMILYITICATSLLAWIGYCAKILSKKTGEKNEP